MEALFDLNELPTTEDDDYNEHSIGGDEATVVENSIGDQPTQHISEHLSGGDQPTEIVQNSTQQSNQQKKPRLNNSQSMQVLNMILAKSKGGKLEHGSIKQLSQELSLSTRVIGRIWATAKQQLEGGQSFNVNNKFKNCGRKRIQIQPEQITSLSMGDRTCLRDIASKLEISKSTCHRMTKTGVLKPHTNALHPGLSDNHKLTRLRWVLSLLQGFTVADKRQYCPMYDFVHLDEKWFYLSKKSTRYYLAENEKGKYRAASSSKFIPKVMFTACVARPRFNAQGECTFDGKIGIFPFTYQAPAKRNSKHRSRGTCITKLVESVNKQVTRAMLIDQILPAIRAKWPNDGTHKLIFIQQDNARTHITQSDKEWQGIYTQENFTFILVQQPANSPDLNILDLGFFRSIQSLMHKKMPRNVDHMLECVNEAFYELDPLTLGNVWMSLQMVMTELLKCKGGNEYDMPHISKRRLGLEGNKPTELMAPTWAIIEAWNTVHADANAVGTSYAIGAMDANAASTSYANATSNQNIEEDEELLDDDHEL